MIDRRSLFRLLLVSPLAKLVPQPVQRYIGVYNNTLLVESPRWEGTPLSPPDPMLMRIWRDSLVHQVETQWVARALYGDADDPGAVI